MFSSINDKLEKFLVKDVNFLPNMFSTVMLKRNVCFYVMLLLVTMSCLILI